MLERTNIQHEIRWSSNFECWFNLRMTVCGIYAFIYIYHIIFNAPRSLYLVVTQLKPRLLPIGEDLPQDDSEAPYVAFRGELPVHDALRGHPANR